FLRFRPERERINKVVFLDVDDQAVAHIGVFPWPRSVMAGALLLLKEYGAAAAIFDIEYIDKSPTRVDEVYLKQGLRADFARHFAEISGTMADILSALSAGFIKAADASAYIDDVAELVAGERDLLYQDTLGITGDNDRYLAEAAALFGKTWGTLNLQDEYPLEGEQAERRAFAEQRFSYPVDAAEGVPGGDYTDILPPIPVFMEALRGAGFTNVEIDRDGTRRRIYLVRKVGDRWYAQLAFAPLLEYLGNPALELRPRRLVMRGALLPGASAPADISIPLDGRGAMMLDWPLTSYQDSFTHVSFARFSYLEEYYAHIKEYLGALGDSRAVFPVLAEGADTILARFEEAEGARQAALETASDRDFERYLRLRDEGFRLTGELLDAAGEYLDSELARYSGLQDDEALRQEAGYCLTLLEYLETELCGTLDTRAYLQEALEGKFCVIGRVDTGTTDIGVNPFHGKYVNVGTHGVVLDTILSRSFITFLPPLWSVVLAFLLVPALIAGIQGFKPALRMGLGICGVFLILGLSLILFIGKGYFLSPLTPVLAMAGALVIRETAAFVGTERDKQFIRKAFSTYLSGEVVQEILNDPGKLALGGATRRMTAIFTDVQGFSTISERLSAQYGSQGGAEALVRLLNDYLSAMSDIVLEQRGTIDKYEGDAIIAFFGAPLELEDHALRACASALLMKRIEGELNKTYRETGLSPTPLYTRIGINTGDMVVGNMGTQKKMDYTIMGNAVNLASRLEGVNKQYGTWIMASEDTIRETGGKLLSRRLDRVRVVGINEPVRLHEVLSFAVDAPSRMLRMVELFHQALDTFENRDWAAAETAFQAVLDHAPEDGPAKLYLERCRQYRNKAPEQWDGIVNLTQK
ncbi:MAG: CHASE2 domain-containing protein, partial [Treponema sp.]|nr:CHASE2 domain-containing protein [Treponema sp.]